MAKNSVVHTCYGCEYFYTDKGDKWPRKHCPHIDHWNECEVWKSFKKESEE